MCGICGIYHIDRERKVSPEVVASMSELLAHRGPDDSGIFIDDNFGIAHRRLSIIDLSQDGHQPMHTTDGRFTIIFNGEVYNYQELKQGLLNRGYHFHSQTDTEVILNLFAEYGRDCVSLLNGMFAFVIWDNKKRSLFAARDRLGIKPFYYMWQDQSLFFASEIKALIKPTSFKPEINQQGLSDYLTFQFTLGEKTLFQDIKKLLPGHTLYINSQGDLTTESYWKLDFSLDLDHTEEYFEHRLLRLLEDAVRIRLRADVPIGAHLSGGLDSSTIASQAADLLGAPIHVFTGGFHENEAYDETRYARIVAERINAHSHDIFPSAQNFVDILPKLIFSMDEPAAGPGVFPQYFVSKLAREYVKVVLGGQGGDEIFGGYTRYLIAYLEEVLHGAINGTNTDQPYVVTFDTIIPNLTQLEGYKPLMRHFWQDGLFGEQSARYFRLINRRHSLDPFLVPDAILGKANYDPYNSFLSLFEEDPNCKAYINKMIRFDTLTLLPALLQVEDRTSMSASLESRVPLLDHRIVEFMASVPPHVKYKNGQSKHLFRQAIRHIVPKRILNRQDKMGFPVPLNEWYQAKILREFLNDILLSSKSRQRGLFETDKLETLLTNSGKYDRGLWGALSLELWFQTFIDG